MAVLVCILNRTSFMSMSEMAKRDGLESRESTAIFPYLDSSFRRKFWKRVRRTDTCWVWTGARSSGGYGQIRLRYSLWYTHRLSWVMAKRPLILGQLIMHKCDNPSCVRPSHLVIGSQVDNMQ